MVKGQMQMVSGPVFIVELARYRVSQARLSHETLACETTKYKTFNYGITLWLKLVFAVASTCAACCLLCRAIQPLSHKLQDLCIAAIDIIQGVWLQG